MTNPPDEFYERQHEASVEATSRLRDAAVASGAVALSIGTGPVVLLTAALQLLAWYFQNRDQDEIRDRVASIEAELRRLRPRGERLSSEAARVAAFLVQREGAKLWDTPDAEETRQELGLTPDVYLEAAQELEYLGLVVLQGNACDPSGISRLQLLPWAFVELAPQIDPSIAIADELARVLARIGKHRDPHQYLLTETLIAELGIALPRLDFLLAALEERELIETHGSAHPNWGSFWAVGLTVAGRRVIRGLSTLEV